MNRLAWIGAVLVLAPAAVVTWTARPTGGDDAGLSLRTAIPVTLGEWRGGDAALDPGTLRMLRTDDYLNRTYDAPGRPPVTLTIVFSRRDRKTVHPPEVCFTGQGWEIEDQAEDRVGGAAGFAAATLRLAREGATLHCLYWYVAGRRTTTSFVGQQWNVALGTLTGEAPGSAMVRITSETPAGAPRALAHEALRDFADEALPYVIDALR